MNNLTDTFAELQRIVKEGEKQRRAILESRTPDKRPHIDAAAIITEITDKTQIR